MSKIEPSGRFKGFSRIQVKYYRLRKFGLHRITRITRRFYFWFAPQFSGQTANEFLNE